MRSLLVTGLMLCALAPSSAQADWLSQLAGNQDLYDVWGSGPDDIYAVGAAGAIYHSTNGGKDWSLEQSGVQEPLYTVWGSGPDNVYAAGDNGTILRSIDQGKTWAQLKSPQLIAYRALEGFGANDIYLVGDNGTILRSVDGATFAPQKSGVSVTLQSIWGASASHVFAVGDNGTILQTTNSGSTWTPIVSGTAEILRGIWGTGPDNMFAVGYKSTILQSKDAGKTWKTVQSGGVEWLGCVWGASANDIFVVGAKGILLRSKDGGATFTQEKTPSTNPLYSIWGTSESLVRIVGRNGTLLRKKLPDPTVTIKALTPGSKIFINEEAQTGDSVTKQLPVGVYQITIENESRKFKPFSKSIKLEEGEVKEFSFENPQRVFYTINVANPPGIVGAEVVFDGVFVGKTPIAIDGIEAGQHKLTIKSPGYQDSTDVIKVDKNIIVLQPELTKVVKLPEWARPESVAKYKRMATIGGVSFGAATVVLWGVTDYFIIEGIGPTETGFEGDTETSIAAAQGKINTKEKIGLTTAILADVSTILTAGLLTARFVIPKRAEKRAQKAKAEARPATTPQTMPQP